METVLNNSGNQVVLDEDVESSRERTLQDLRQIILENTKKINAYIQEMRDDGERYRASDLVDVASSQTLQANNNAIAEVRRSRIKSAETIIDEIQTTGWNFKCNMCEEDVSPDMVVSRLSMLCPDCQELIK